MRDAGQLPHMTALAHAMKLSITLHLCSLASAVKYGRRQALRQWRGIFVGFAVVAFVSSLAVWFLGAVLNRYLRVLAWVGAGCIFWLAWHILQSDGGAEVEAGAHCNFITGLLVQLTNAKIMIFCMTALTTCAPPFTTIRRSAISRWQAPKYRSARRSRLPTIKETRKDACNEHDILLKYMQHRAEQRRAKSKSVSAWLGNLHGFGFSPKRVSRSGASYSKRKLYLRLL